MNQEIACWLYDYNDLTGEVYHRFDHGRARCGQRVGWVNAAGYRQTKYKGVTYMVTHIIWLMVHGYLPEEIDHWDGDPAHDYLFNLREASRSQNQANKKYAYGASGTRGVHRNPSGSKWRARIARGGQGYFLGDFETIEEASAAYKRAAEELYGSFAFQNRPTLETSIRSM